MLRHSIFHPHLSAYTHIFGEFDYNRTPLSPEGTGVVIHNRKNDRASWAQHEESGWYTRPAMEQYINHNEYIPPKRSKRVSDTVEFYPQKNQHSIFFSADAIIHAVQDLIKALQNTAPFRPIVALRNEHKAAFRYLEDIFGK